jgi:hypothetical protein
MGVRRIGRLLAGALLLTATACAGDEAAPPAPTQGPSTSGPSTSGPSVTAVTVSAVTTTTLVAAPVTTTVTRASFLDDAAAVEGIARTTFQYPGSPLTPEEAQCIGAGLVHVFGRSRVEQLGFGIGRWTLLGFATALGPWDRADSEAVVDTFRVCTPNWELLAILSATQGAEAISITSARCVAAARPDDEARELFVQGLVRAPGRPEQELRARELYAPCLTPAEMAAVDLG